VALAADGVAIAAMDPFVEVPACYSSHVVFAMQCEALKQSEIDRVIAGKCLDDLGVSILRQVLRHRFGDPRIASNARPHVARMIEGK
jgi:hypothetical protein